MIKLAVLGSTGSVGTQTLQVVEKFKEEVEITALVAKRASEKLLHQVIRFKPKIVVSYEIPSKQWLSHLPSETEYLHGDSGLTEAVRISDRVMNAIGGVSGIKPTNVILKEKKILLASNKESIICLGDIVKKNRELIIPVDSEHSALFQLMHCVNREEIKCVYITASGGPFKDWSLEEMKKATVEQALKHPRWNMGAKITVDSATLMNKGFEMLEAVNLFNLDMEKVKVVIHPESSVHGAVQLKDGTFLMHVGKTDMRIPITYAVFYPQRKNYPFGETSLLSLSPLHFEEVDESKFKAISLVRTVSKKGGAYIPALVGADEESVDLFLKGKIGFLDIVPMVERVLEKVNIPAPKTVEEILFTVEWARKQVKEIYEKEYAKVG